MTSKLRPPRGHIQELWHSSVRMGHVEKLDELVMVDRW